MWVTWVTADDDADAFGRHTAGTTWTRHVPPSWSSVCSIINNDDDEDDDGCPLAVAVGDAVVQVCECLWSAMGHASVGYGSGRSININIIATACAITCDINDAVGWGRELGRGTGSGGHVHHLGMFINCHLELRLLAVSGHLTLACQRYKFVALYRCIFVFCIF